MNTVHLDVVQNGFYRTRRPWLRLDILSALVLHGELTKGSAEKILNKRHGDILDSFDSLEKKELIKKGRLAYGRGREQFYYKITDKGLVTLFTFEPVCPSKFWKSIFGYFHHFNKEYKITSETVYELFLQFGKVYFRYSHYNLPVQYDTFVGMRNRWFKHLKKSSRTGVKKITIEQKIIEALALHPRLTLKDLSMEIGEAEIDVNRVLRTYTPDSFNPSRSKESGLILRNMMNDITDRKFDDEYHVSFLFHNLVRINEEDHVHNYELTLFGVVLALNLVRYHSTHKLDNGSFYGTTLSFSKYFETIVDNYKNSLPLIFDKWRLLKKVLGTFAFYNFDVTLDRLERSRASIRKGGNREIFDGIKDIKEYRYQQLYDFAKAGQAVSFIYLTGISYTSVSDTISRGYRGDYILRNEIKIDRPDLERLAPVHNLLMGLLLMLSPVEYLTSAAQSTEIQQVITKPELLKIMEESLADEISALYYFNLFDLQEFRTVFSVDKMRHSAPESSIPKECLYRILRNDVKGSLRDWFNRWITDIAELQKENYKILKPLV